MARLVGVDLPRKKKIRFALTYIFGIGPTLAKKILEITKIDPDTRVDRLTESDVSALREAIEKNYSVEGDLRRSIGFDIKRLVEINTYRGQRHKRGLPVRGQRTKTNAKTRRGRKGGLMKKKA